MTDKLITKAFCNSARLVFRPKSYEEAVFIQEQLLAMGVIWGDGTTRVSKVPECVAKGILVDHGKLYYNPTNDPNNIECSTEQFNGNYVPPERKFLIEQFNKLHERLEKIEKRLEALEQPTPLDKPPLKKPQP